MNHYQIYAIMRFRGFSDGAIALYETLLNLRDSKGEVDFGYSDFHDLTDKSARTFTDQLRELMAGRLVTRFTRSKLWVLDLPNFSETEAIQLMCEKGSLFRKLCLSALLFGRAPATPTECATLQIADETYGRTNGPTLDELRNLQPNIINTSRITPKPAEDWQETADTEQETAETTPHLKIKDKYKSNINLNNRQTFKRSALNIATEEDLNNFRRLCEAVRERFGDERSEVKLDLIETIAGCMWLNLTDAPEVERTFKRARQLKRQGDLKNLYVYFPNVLKIWLARGGLLPPVYRPNCERKRAKLAELAEAKKITIVKKEGVPQ